MFENKQGSENILDMHRMSGAGGENMSGGKRGGEDPQEELAKIKSGFYDKDPEKKYQAAKKVFNAANKGLIKLDIMDQLMVVSIVFDMEAKKDKEEAKTEKENWEDPKKELAKIKNGFYDKDPEKKHKAARYVFDTYSKNDDKFWLTAEELGNITKLLIDYKTVDEQRDEKKAEKKQGDTKVSMEDLFTHKYHNKEREEIAAEWQKDQNRKGEIMDLKVSGKEKRQRKRLLHERSRLEEKIAEQENAVGKDKDPVLEKKLKDKFDKVNAGILNSYNKQDAPSTEMLLGWSGITEKDVNAYEDRGMHIWNIKKSYAQKEKDKEAGKKSKTDIGIDMARTIMKQALDPVPDGKQTDDQFDSTDIQVILKYFLSQEKLSEDDKELLLRFARKFISSSDIQSEVFGYKQDMIDPDLYLEKMKDPELMSESDRKKIKNDKPEKHEDRKKDRKDERHARRKAIHKARTEFHDRKKEILDSDDEKDEKKEKIKEAKKKKREKIEDAHYEHSEKSKYVQLSETHDKLSNNLAQIKGEHAYNEEKDNADKLYTGKKDEVIKEPRVRIFTSVLNTIKEMSAVEEEKEIENKKETNAPAGGPETESKEKNITSKTDKETSESGKLITIPSGKEKEDEGFKIENTHLPPLYADLYEAQNEVFLAGNDDVKKKAALYKAYHLFNPNISAADFDAKLTDGSIKEEDIFKNRFNSNFYEGDKLKEPETVLQQMKQILKKVSIGTLKEEIKLNPKMQYFEKRFIAPFLKPKNLVALGGSLLFADWLIAKKTGVSGSLTTNVSNIPFSSETKFGESSLGKSNKFSTFKIDNTKNKLLGDTAEKNETNPSALLNLSLSRTIIPKDKEALIKKKVYEVLLNNDVLFGNKTGNTNAFTQADFYIKNISALPPHSLEAFLKDPAGFMKTFADPVLKTSPDKSVYDFQQRVTATYFFKNNTFQVGAGGAEWNAASSKKEFSITPSAIFIGKANLTPGLQIKYSADVKTLIMTEMMKFSKAPVVDANASFTMVKKLIIGQNQTGVHVTVGGHYNSAGNNSVDLKAGFEKALGKDFIWGAEVDLNYDVGKGFHLYNQFLKESIYLKFTIPKLKP